MSMGPYNPLDMPNGHVNINLLPDPNPNGDIDMNREAFLPSSNGTRKVILSKIRRGVSSLPRPSKR